MTATFSTGRPTLGFRIGITGARSLGAAQLPRLSQQLRAMLCTAKQEIRRLGAEEPAIAAAYDSDSIGKPHLRFVSPLARGSDRLAAQEAIKLGYSLHVPMPFSQSEYGLDFETPEDLAEFRKLLACAGNEWLALDGDHGPEVNRAYEAVGRYVVRHCDLLIAIWDGSQAAGQGGTADIVRFAAVSGVPVWWVHATADCAPIWIADVQDLRDPPQAPKLAEAQLHSYLLALIRPPHPCHRHRHGFVGRLARLGQSRHVSPETEHFVEREHSQRWYWQAFAKLILWTSGHQSARSARRRPDDPVALYWFERYEPADSRAIYYAVRYRSGYVWVFFLGTLAVICGALALVLGLLQPATAAKSALAGFFAVLEFIALGLILALLLLGIRRDWHEHSIEFRMLAELYRKQQMLGPLGWTLPIIAVRRLSGSDEPAPNRAAWVAWLFATEQRSAPLPQGSLAQAAEGAPRNAVLEELVAEQRSYHIARGQMAEAAGHTLVRWGEVLFCAVLGCVVLKLLLADVVEAPGWAILFGFLATVLPAVSAAFVGVRAYAELQLLAERSHYMVAELERAHHRIERLATRRTLVSQDLGAEAATVATLMLQDLEGWAQLFRVKGMEPS